MKMPRKLWRFLAAAVGLVVLAALLMPVAMRGPAEEAVSVTRIEANSPQGSPASTLKLLTLNLAHGRGEGWHQALQKRSTIEGNLDAVAEVLAREKPDLAALQEADGPSIWSGGFDHVEYLARAAGFPFFVRGEHVRGFKLAYGTALLAKWRLKDAVSYAFDASPPTPTKGFIVAHAAWPGHPEQDLTLVSVHLDFSRTSVQRKQIDRMVEKLQNCRGPLVVLGDFNCDWSDPEGPLRTLADRLHLRPYQPTASDAVTFAGTGRRIDWVLVSSEIEFVEYRTLPDRVSDHRGVVAVVRINGQKPHGE